MASKLKRFLVLSAVLIIGCENDYSSYSLDDEEVVLLNHLTQDNVGRGYYDGRPFTGLAITLGRDDQLTYRVSFSYGEIHGLAEEWFPSGSQRSLVEYTNHIKDGLALSWNNNEYLNTVVHYKNDIKQGLAINFDINGEVDQYFCYDDDEQVNQDFCVTSYMKHYVDYLDYVIDDQPSLVLSIPELGDTF
jgi:antitoxin component YwqK of YwqJK toxin-antitoxin module